MRTSERPLLLLVTQFLLAALLTTLLDNAYNWYLFDITKTAAAATLAAVCVYLIPYSRLRNKCIAAAIAGFLFVDLVFAVVGFMTRQGSGWYVVAAQCIALVLSTSFYYFRSYKVKSCIPEQSRVYCIRKVPSTKSGLVISLLGIFGVDGEYSIYCRGKIYRFKGGVLISENYVHQRFRGYHCSKGVAATDEIEDELKQLIGTEWHLFGSNCVTTLGRFWHKNG